LIAALDPFTVPTLTFRALYGFFVIEHHRRRILHFSTPARPPGDWISIRLNVRVLLLTFRHRLLRGRDLGLHTRFASVAHGTGAGGL
jgi:hypothetical protein